MSKRYTIIYSVILSVVTLQCIMHAQHDTKWTYPTGGPVYSSPLLIDQSLFIGSDDGNLYCLDSQTGEKKWEFKTGGVIRCKPAFYNSAVFFESDDGFLYSVDASTGKELWIHNIGNYYARELPGIANPGENYWDYMQSSPYISGGVVYAGSSDSSLYAIDADKGTLKWKVRTNGIIRSSPCVSEGIVYVGSFDGFIYAFECGDGKKVWEFDTHGKDYKHVQSSPLVVNNVLYCGSRNPYFYALDSKTGKELWKNSYGGSWVESSAILHDDVIYVGSSDYKTVFAFEPETGEKRWSTVVPGYPWSTPFCEDGVVYIGIASYNEKEETGGSITAINAEDGIIMWQKECEKSELMGGVVSSPVVEDGVVFYGSLDGKIYAVNTEK